MTSIMDELGVPKQLYEQPSPLIPLLLIGVVAAMVGLPYYCWVRIEEPLVEMANVGPLVIPLLLLLALRLLYSRPPSLSPPPPSPAAHMYSTCIHRRAASPSSHASCNYDQPASFGWGLLALLLIYLILLPLANNR